jgi:CRISPR-associated protein Cas1
MSYLYVYEHNTDICIKDNQIVAKKPDECKIIFPIERVEGIILFGKINVTAGVIIECLQRGIPLTWLSPTGSFFGRLESTQHVNIERQTKQFSLRKDGRSVINFSKQVIKAKIANQTVILRRYNRYKKYEIINTIINEMWMLIRKISQADTVEKILGYEGAASKKYFQCLSILADEDFKFGGRNKRPPRDKFNSLLSFGYSLLLNIIHLSLVNKGLNPYAGLIHQDRQGHPALASDLIEEWRPVIVDSLVLSLVNGHIIKQEHFSDPDEKGGIYLNHKGIKIFITEFEKKIRSDANYLDYIDYRMSFRSAIQYQCGMLAKSFENADLNIYHPVRIR